MKIRTKALEQSFQSLFWTSANVSVLLAVFVGSSSERGPKERPGLHWLTQSTKSYF